LIELIITLRSDLEGLKQISFGVETLPFSTDGIKGKYLNRENALNYFEKIYSLRNRKSEIRPSSTCMVCFSFDEESSDIASFS
jgi:hypothetical protein